MATAQETLDMMKGLLSTPIPADILKAAGWSQPANSTTGLQGYNLEPRARQLFPVLTPLRNMIPRRGGGFGTAVNWRALTGINTTLIEPGMSQGNRGQYITHTTKDFSAAYKTLGLDDFVTEQAQWAGRTFEDILALGTDALLWSLMIAEENVLLGGDTSLQLGTTPTPVATIHATGGSLAHATYSIICVALAHNAYYATQGSVVGTAPIRAAVSATTANGQSITYGGGAAQKSAAASATIASPGGAGSIGAHVAIVPGAMAYAWFWGASGSEVLGAITTINSVLITAAATGTQTAASLPSSDNSTNAYVYDGILSQIFTSGSGSQIITQANGVDGIGTPLTAVGDGSIGEFDQLLQNFWNVNRLSPDTFWMNAQQRQDLQKKIQAGSNNATQRFIFSTDQKTITGASLATGYINKYGMSSGGPYAEGNVIEFKTHPNIAPGTIMATSKSLPYMNSNVPNVIELDLRLEYYQRQYAPQAPSYQFGVYYDGVLKVYAPFALGAITNIAQG